MAEVNNQETDRINEELPVITNEEILQVRDDLKKLDKSWAALLANKMFYVEGRHFDLPKAKDKVYNIVNFITRDNGMRVSFIVKGNELKQELISRSVDAKNLINGK